MQRGRLAKAGDFFISNVIKSLNVSHMFLMANKKVCKLLIYRLSLSFFIVEGGLFHDPLWGTAQRKSPVSLLRRLPGFFIYFNLTYIPQRLKFD